MGIVKVYLTLKIDEYYSSPLQFSLNITFRKLTYEPGCGRSKKPQISTDYKTRYSI